MGSADKGLILIVDDDSTVAAAVSMVLSAEGYRVQAAANAFQARGMLQRLEPVLVILDRRLPDADGLELCREIRSTPSRRSLPVLFLSLKGSMAERVVGLETGADDYLPKPFANEELLARVRALLRRAAAPEPASPSLRWGKLVMDLERRKVTLNGKPVELAPKEFDLLHALLASSGRVLSRRFLLERVWGYERAAEVTARAVDTTVSSLRAKLGPAGKRIVGVLNQGYRLEDP